MDIIWQLQRWSKVTTLLFKKVPNLKHKSKFLAERDNPMVEVFKQFRSHYLSANAYQYYQSNSLFDVKKINDLKMWIKKMDAFVCINVCW